jgi:hypothetical protein
MGASKMHACKMHAREIHARKRHAREIHARKRHAREMHASMSVVCPCCNSRLWRSDAFNRAPLLLDSSQLHCDQNVDSY